ncbi:mannose-1-phosphate guanylyltransferase/mannose-6-phosphate isomerase [Zavarzinia sp. CC-PAN008]|uniref:mannose-1-phosphate guanylyltransferase/mannose-6-phosphate isomerase n=1 Tax=Zavarzinia sp. CC-PAN008 TaxID=3243332 RepID=UPI003F749510
MIIPVILSGGSGTRLFPMSRSLMPKQLLPLVSERTMLQETALRVPPAAGFGNPIVICNEDHRFLIAEQLRAVGVTPQAIMLEPAARNTAPAVAATALVALQGDPDALILVLASDHQIARPDAFLEAIGVAERVARQSRIVVFGITPTAPETGYGYIEQGAAIEGGAFAVAAFREKPDLATAEAYVAGGRHTWNSGMFLAPAALLLDELRRFEPEVVRACEDAVAAGARDLDFLRLSPAFAGSPSISLDYAVMERTDKGAVVPAAIGWSDVGSWSALWELGERDADGNVLVGDVISHNSRDTYVRTSGPLVATLGLKDVVVVATGDVVLVADRAQVQDVKAIVDRLKAQGRPEATSHTRAYRPWGWYETLALGDRFQVKQILVKPGARLSLQMHYHRAEHWVVVEGTGLITRDNQSELLHENQSTYIPLGAVHRLENPGKVPLRLIEVQSGSYLGEDDIVRLDDNYGRAPKAAE